MKIDKSKMTQAELLILEDMRRDTAWQTTRLRQSRLRRENLR